MDMTAILPYVVQAIGGAVGGNILGLITRGGGGLVGRTVIGALAGVAAGYAATAFPDTVGAVTALWGSLPVEGDAGTYLSNLITGAAGGGVVGLVAGLLLRPKA